MPVSLWWRDLARPLYFGMGAMNRTLTFVIFRHSCSSLCHERCSPASYLPTAIETPGQQRRRTWLDTLQQAKLNSAQNTPIIMPVRPNAWPQRLSQPYSSPCPGSTLCTHRHSIVFAQARTCFGHVAVRRHQWCKHSHRSIPMAIRSR